MTIETATLLAVAAAPLAVLAAIAAVAAGLFVRRVRRDLLQAGDRLVRAEVRLHRDLSVARISLEQTQTTVHTVRARGHDLDVAVASWSTPLRATRTTLERLSHGRLGPTVRALRLASALGRIALLWRAPAR